MNKENNKRKTYARDSEKKLSYQHRQNMISGFAAFLTLGSLAAYIMVSISQGDKTRESLRLTQRSINLADSNFIIENRAWVGLTKPIRAVEDASEFDKIGFYFDWQIQNFGKTPAESLCIGYNVFIGDNPDNRKLIIEPPCMLSPSQPKDCEFFYPIADESLRVKIRSNRKKLYFIGVLTYKDIYGRTDTTQFTFLYVPPPMTTSEGCKMLPVGINRMK